MGKGNYLPLPGNVVFLCITSYSKTLSIRIVFMHYFHNLLSTSGAHSICGPRWGTFVPIPIISPPLEKNPAGAHGHLIVM